MLRILICDDDISCASSIGDFVSSEFRHRVFITVIDTVSNAVNELHSGEPYSLVVTDINFASKGGERGGLRIAEAARRALPLCEIVALTGYSEALGWEDVLFLAERGVRRSSWICKQDVNAPTAIRRIVYDMLQAGKSLRVSGNGIRKLWGKCISETDSVQKGRLLERFVYELFRQESGFKIVQVNRRLVGEEIDVLVQNDVGKPFWQSLRSPYLMIECKNWSGNVGNSVVMTFRGKLENHKNLCRVGIIVSPKGFTRGCYEELRRLGNSDTVIVLLDGDHVTSYLGEGGSVATWLERCLSASIA